jgi:hypothetical protein
MIKLNFPPSDLRVREYNDRKEIFDPLRKKFVLLTDEEWVRQNLISYLATDREIPLTMMASERGLLVNNLPKRFDLLVFATDGKPLMIVECKSPHIPVDEEVFYQAARYNITLQVEYLLITNGMEHHCIKINYNTGETKFLKEIPLYSEL